MYLCVSSAIAFGSRHSNETDALETTGTLFFREKFERVRGRTDEKRKSCCADSWKREAEVNSSMVETSSFRVDAEKYRAWRLGYVLLCMTWRTAPRRPPSTQPPRGFWCQDGQVSRMAQARPGSRAHVRWKSMSRFFLQPASLGWTCELVHPVLDGRTSHTRGELSFRLLPTGHGRFDCYLHRTNREPTSVWSLCTDARKRSGEGGWRALHPRVLQSVRG